MSKVDTNRLDKSKFGFKTVPRTNFAKTIRPRPYARFHQLSRSCFSTIPASAASSVENATLLLSPDINKSQPINNSLQLSTLTLFTPAAPAVALAPVAMVAVEMQQQMHCRHGRL